MDMYDIAAGAKLAYDRAATMDDNVDVAKDLIRALSMFSARIDDDGDRSAFDRVVANVEIALDELERSCREISEATNIDRIRAPLTFGATRMRFGDQRGTGMHMTDNGDVCVEWIHGDGRRTGTRFTAVAEYVRDDHGGISAERPVTPKKAKKVA